MSIFDDPNFDEMFQNAIYNSRTDEVDADVIKIVERFVEGLVYGLDEARKVNIVNLFNDFELLF